MLTNTLYNKHVISITELSKNELELIINFASKLKKNYKTDLLKNKLVACCFFEPSTRTRLSFESAVNRQGGKVIGFADAKNTSVRKGETLADTARIISSYVDAIVMRHNKDGASRVVSKFSTVPVINAGDGTNQHPSQTLLDLLSIFETQKTIENLKVAFVGDLKYGRTVHSLAQALTLFNCEFFFISPQNLAMPDYICEELQEKNIKYTIIDNIEEAIKYTDILYMTRIQKERFDEQEFMKIKGDFHIQKSMLTHVKNNFKILHPLPRVDEIHSDVDNTNYAYYFQQARNGLFIRQALLSLVLNENIAGII